MKTMAVSDQKLVQETLSGDRKAFEDLIRRYERLVFNVVYHYLGSDASVEDLAQEVFLKLYTSLDRYDLTRPFKSWVGTITANHCIDELRRRKRDRVRIQSDLLTEEAEEARNLIQSYEQGRPLTEEQAKFALDLLHTAMEDLNEKDRLAFVLRELEGLEYSELASILESSEVAVRIRVSRTKKKLQEELEEKLHAL